MKIYNVVVPKEFTQNGEVKKAWNNVGKLIKWDATQDKPENFTLELSMFPTTKFGVFEQKPKVAPVIPKENLEAITYPQETDITPEEIPF